MILALILYLFFQEPAMSETSVQAFRVTDVRPFPAIEGDKRLYWQVTGYPDGLSPEALSIIMPGPIGFAAGDSINVSVQRRGE